MSAASEQVSPTAYATGYFWYRHGLSHPALATPQGKRLDRGFGLLIGAAKALSGISLEALMLARHRGIDARLTQAIEEGRVSQVIEIAAGLSPRGWAFSKRYGKKLRYLETDLPQMAATKRRLLDGAGLLGKQHQVLDLDALSTEGPDSLAAIAATLNPKKGTAIITEGLMNYLSPTQARFVWNNIAETLQRFPQGLYLADAYLMDEQRSAGMAAFGAALQLFVRGRMHVHYRTEPEAIATLKAAGFGDIAMHRAAGLPVNADIARTRGADRVRILEALT